MWRSAVAHHRAAGHEVRVLTTDWREPYVDRSTPEDLDVHRELRWYWHDHEFPNLGPRGVLAVEKHNAATLDRHIEEFRPDAVAWWAMGGMSLSMIERAHRAGLRAAGVVVDDWLLYGPKVDSWRRTAKRAGPFARVLERATGIPARFGLEGAARWLFASHLLRERAAAEGFSPPGATVAHPGIDLELFNEPSPVRPEWSWQLLYVGRIDERKGIDLAVSALTELPPEAALRVVGGGDESYRAVLDALIADLGVGDRVHFERLPREELPAAYAAADAVLFPVRWLEPFGLVPLEAMACGAPVAASGRGGSAEYLRDGENCVLFEVDDGPEALAAAVGRLAEKPALRAALRDGGRRTALANDESAFNEAVLAALG
jgi:glycosyltransferase involved in cell wall biosynthesis